MKITENKVTYEIPLIILSMLRQAEEQARAIGQTISVKDFYEALPKELRDKIKVTYG